MMSGEADPDSLEALEAEFRINEIDDIPQDELRELYKKAIDALMQSKIDNEEIVCKSALDLVLISATEHLTLSLALLCLTHCQWRLKLCFDTY